MGDILIHIYRQKKVCEDSQPGYMPVIEDKVIIHADLCGGCAVSNLDLLLA